MVYGRPPFASLHMVQKFQAIVNPDYKIKFPELISSDDSVINAMQLCLQRDPNLRPPIIGKNGLLNEHRFLH